MKTIMNLIAVACIVYGLFGNSLFDILDTPVPVIPLAPAVEVNTPSDELASLVKPMAEEITDTEDRVELALYFLELSKRVAGYDGVSLQQFNDIFVRAAGEVFSTRLNGKYDDLDVNVTKIVVEVTGVKNHTLTLEECKALAARFEAFAWALVQR